MAPSERSRYRLYQEAFDGKGPSYVFSNADVEVIITQDKIIDEIRQKLTEPEIY